MNGRKPQFPLIMLLTNVHRPRLVLRFVKPSSLHSSDIYGLNFPGCQSNACCVCVVLKGINIWGVKIRTNNMFSISMSTEIQISHNLILCFILHALIYFFIQTHLKALETHVEYLKLRILCHDKFHRYATLQA